MKEEAKPHNRCKAEQSWSSNLGTAPQNSIGPNKRGSQNLSGRPKTRIACSCSFSSWHRLPGRNTRADAHLDRTVCCGVRVIGIGNDACHELIVQVIQCASVTRRDVA